MPYASSEVISLPPGSAELDSARIRWKRSAQARRVSLRIDPRDGVIVVTLPSRTSRSAGMALVVDHASWIGARLAALPEAVAFADGARVPLAGEPLCIRHVPDVAGVRLAAGAIEVGGAPAELAHAVGEFLRAEAHRRLSALAQTKAARLGRPVRRVTVKDTISRWASCTRDSALMFSWRLVLAPEPVQDYVAAHEVAHLRHMNHGSRFAALVDELTPHARPAEAWLRRHGSSLLRIG